MIDLLNTHYSFTSVPSVHDEEALTALELAGRQEAKINEVIKDQNALRSETEKHLKDQDNDIQNQKDVEIPNKIAVEVQNHIDKGDFDRAINKYAGELEARIDNMMNNVPEGSTTMDVEVIDGRVTSKGVTYATLGEAVRSQHESIDSFSNTLLSPFAASYGYLFDLNRKELWEQGWIKTTGENSDPTAQLAPKALRTIDFIPDSVEYVIVKSGYMLGVRIYDLNGTFVEAVGNASMYEFETSYSFDHENYKYKLLLVKGVNGYLDDLIMDECYNIVFCSVKNDIITTLTPKDIGIIASAVNNGYDADYNNRLVWEQGFINSTTGVNSTSTSGWHPHAIRTIGYLPENIKKIEVSTGWFSLRIYKKDGTFDSSIGGPTTEGWLKEYSDFNHTTYNYRVIYANAFYNAKTYVSDYDNVHFYGEEHEGLSKFRRKIDWGIPSADFYTGKLSDYDYFNADTEASEIYSLYNQLDGVYPGYIEKSTIGTDCAGNAMYAYTFTPKTMSNKLKNIPTVIIQSGIHGFEKSSVFGLYYFMRDICENWQKSSVLEYFRFNVKFIIIPVVNPTGFNAKTYTNTNGVNLNRNFDCNWTLIDDPSSDQYGGASAFDQPESQAIRDLLLNNLDACLFVDFHTYGGSSVEIYENINWFSLDIYHDGYYARLSDAIRYHVSRITQHFNSMYELNLSHDNLCGKMSGLGTNRGNGLSKSWACTQGVLGLTMEGFNGFPNEEAHTPNVHKANSELIGNWLSHFINYFKE